MSSRNDTVGILSAFEPSMCSSSLLLSVTNKAQTQTAVDDFIIRAVDCSTCTTLDLLFNHGQARAGSRDVIFANVARARVLTKIRSDASGLHSTSERVLKIWWARRTMVACGLEMEDVDRENRSSISNHLRL